MARVPSIVVCRLLVEDDEEGDVAGTWRRTEPRPDPKLLEQLQTERLRLSRLRDEVAREKDRGLIASFAERITFVYGAAEEAT
jgi:hypothetical protein